MITPSRLLYIRRLQLQTMRLVETLFAGAYRSVFKGKGIEFEEVREYVAGDDIRSIDWNVTARMGHPYIKTFREERELTVLLMVDVSASTLFGTGEKNKREQLAELAAAFALSAIRNQDRVGLVLFSNKVEKYIPPKKGTRHVLRLIRDLLLFEPKDRETDLKEAFRFVGNVQKKAAICFLLSDFFAPDYRQELIPIAKHHDLIGVCLRDPCEMSFPKVGCLTLCDLESKETVVVDSEQDEKPFQEAALSRISTLRTLFQKNGADLIHIEMGKPYATALRQFFQTRRRRR